MQMMCCPEGSSTVILNFGVSASYLTIATVQGEKRFSSSSPPPPTNQHNIYYDS